MMIKYFIRLKPEFKMTKGNLPRVEADRVVHTSSCVKFFRDGTPEPILIIPTANILSIEEEVINE